MTVGARIPIDLLPYIQQFAASAGLTRPNGEPNISAVVTTALHMMLSDKTQASYVQNGVRIAKDYIAQRTFTLTHQMRELVDRFAESLQEELSR